MSAVATDSIEGLYRVCAKIYASDSRGLKNDAAVFVPIFHEWIREKKLDMVLLDVADYAHAPESPGIVLVAHEVTFSLDRSDGRLGLLAQRRTPIEGGVVKAIEKTLAQARQVVEMLSKEKRVIGKVRFDLGTVRIESNDRMRAANSDEGYEALRAVTAEAVKAVYGKEGEISRVENDPRDRLALDVRL
jgi:hypothetical protein